MIPIILDPSAVRIALIGRGEIAASRLAWLREGGSTATTVFSDLPSPDLLACCLNLQTRLPSTHELGGFHLVWIAGLPLDRALPLVDACRNLNILVNLEDQKDGCDFHNPSVVRRGDLLLTVSTAGRSPGMAVRIRRFLEQTFGEEWAERLNMVAVRRGRWKRRTRSLKELSRLTDAVIDSQRWLEQEQRA